MSPPCLRRIWVDYCIVCNKTFDGTLKNVTTTLQGVDVDIVTGYKMIQTVKDTLQVVSFHRT